MCQYPSHKQILGKYFFQKKSEFVTEYFFQNTLKKEKTNAHAVIKSCNLPPFNMKWGRPALMSLP
jgi:hypothetical protein